MVDMAAVSTEQQLRFRWNDHMQHVSKILTLQRLEEHFCDVTLVTEDGFVMKAHQAILASTSAYFQRVLSEVTSDQYPMIVLRGASFREMSCLLDYMYQGNTQVDHSLMERVLEVADMLEVKGLSRIRSNISIKKFMGTAASPNTNSKTSPLNVPCTDNPRGSTKSPEDQFYCGNQVDTRITDTESTQMKLTSSACDSRGTRDTQHLPGDGPPISHTQPVLHTSQHEVEPQDDDDMTQTSGIDLSMAKNEPWSPREGDALSGQKEDSGDESPSKKKKKHQESLCSEERLDPVLDPDWGRIGTKLEERTRHKPRTISLTSITTTDNDLCLLRHKSPPSKNEDTALPSLPLVEKTLEVPCEDGPLTISLTTGQDLDGWRSITKRKPLFCTSLPLKRAKRKFKARRTLDEGRKKWLAKERRSLFGSDSNERPITRALERLKKKTVSPVLESMEKVSVNCDPPFPTDEETAKTKKDKENILSLNSTPEENTKVQMSVKSVVNENKEPNVWELADKRIPDNKFEESSDMKFPAINPLSLFTLPPVKEREKQTRTTLTLEEKVKVIEAFLDGKSQRQIAHLYGIGKTQVSGIIKRREEILTIYRDSLLRGEKLTMKRQRKSEYALLNQHLIQWYRHMTVVAGVKITTGMLRGKALQIAPELGYHDFKASNGWLATFKSNNNLKFSKQRKAESYNDQGNSQHDNPRDEEETFFEDGETDNSSSHLPLTKHLAGPSNIAAGASNEDGSNSDITINRGSQSVESSSVNQSDQGSSLIHPGLSSTGVPKPPQMVNASLGVNLNAAAAYNLSRDLTRDLSRGDSTGVGDISSATMNSSPLNHPVSALNVSRSVIDNPLSKPSDTALATYKSEEPLTYGYDPQNRMNDASSRGTEYNYTPYGFPGGYYGYHFLGQY
ncbi:uncharacterized protein [Cherax quadricarinatus]|uniref:uncharacterized protein isoform X2 n=1 Tax=Cherax quadricarinatus TaxID=27406 RepID=UPI00387E5D7C